jgi:hypothetical protein
LMNQMNRRRSEKPAIRVLKEKLQNKDISEDGFKDLINKIMAESVTADKLTDDADITNGLFGKDGRLFFTVLDQLKLEETNSVRGKLLRLVIENMLTAAPLLATRAKICIKKNMYTALHWAKYMRRV